MELVFERQKSKAVAEFKAACHAGDVDGELILLLEEINSLSKYYTTSSCGGRIVLSSNACGKRDNVFLGRWHRIVEAGEVSGALKSSLNATPPPGVVYFRFEPAILHAAARDVASADGLLKAALKTGFKRSGIQSIKEGRVMLEILGTERLDAPVADGSRILADDAYLSFLTSIANEKLRRNTRKIKKLLAEVSSL